jgi:hypothetical protein
VTASVLFCCVAENRPRFATLVENLAISLRSFGGEYRDAPFVALFVDGVEGTFRARLERLGVEVQVVPRVAGGNPLANKLRMLELSSARAFDVLVGLDCDTIVVSDPGPWVDPERVGAKPADFDLLNDQEWRGVYASLGLTLPARTLRATATGTAIPPYFNSGVIFVPHGLCAPLGSAWADAYQRLGEAVRRDPSLIREQWRWLVEQLSLGCAITVSGLPWHALPSALNFPTHVAVVRESVPASAVILHYHAEHDEQGFLFRSRTAEMDPVLDAFNRRRAAVTGQAYHGMRRAPWPSRARRAVADRFWASLADRSWYRSAVATKVRKRVKRAIASGG